MSLADLRKELKDLRKATMPTPVSRMKKTDVARELERLKGLHTREVKEVKEVLAKEEVPKKVAKKVEAVQKTEHKKQEEVVRTTKPKPKVAPEEPKPVAKKVEKGSEEAKARMAALRAMRKAKKESE
jgi:hypothetical protein